MTLDAWQFGDPAKVAERMELDRLGCSLCSHQRVTMMRVWCGCSSNERQRGFPVVGHRCKWFVELEAKGESNEAGIDR